jgi:hypothetical protein
MNFFSINRLIYLEGFSQIPLGISFIVLRETLLIVRDVCPKWHLLPYSPRNLKLTKK